MLKYTQFIYCPKCSLESLIQLDENGFQCQKCNLKYYHNTASAVGVIIKTPKGILLTVRAQDPSKGLIDIPGGFTNYNETLEEALVREIKEELNIEIDSVRYMASFPNTYKYAEITYFTTDVIFTANWNCNRELELSEEIERCFFIDPRDINFDLLAFNSTKLAMKKFIELETIILNSKRSDAL